MATHPGLGRHPAESSVPIARQAVEPASGAIDGSGPRAHVEYQDRPLDWITEKLRQILVSVLSWFIGRGVRRRLHTLIVIKRDGLKSRAQGREANWGAAEAGDRPRATLYPHSRVLSLGT